MRCKRAGESDKGPAVKQDVQLNYKIYGAMENLLDEKAAERKRGEWERTWFVNS